MDVIQAAATLSRTFSAIQEPAEVLLQEAAAAMPCNPFYTVSYVRAQQELGTNAWLLKLERGGVAVACLAFLRSGRLNRALEIPSWPDFEADDTARFWDSVLKFCRQQGITELTVNSFGSERARIPAWPGERLRRKRCEYVLDLQGIDLWKQLSSNHARNIKRARKLGLTVRRTREPEACRAHVALMAASLDRRRERGETVLAQDALKPVLALVTHGAGDLFQIGRPDEVYSSILVLTADRGAYYHSAGTSPDGMSSGASHALIHEIALMLQAQGIERFNLGGADDPSGGLERFKTGFGAKPNELEAAEFTFSSPMRRAISRIVHGITAMRCR